MIDSIIKYPRSQAGNYQFSILIPTWNNVAFVKNCINSITKNSQLPVQIIVIVNEGKDDTLNYLQGLSNIDYLHAKNNVGICYALNIARSMAKAEYLVYANDDMYFLPNWDVQLAKEIKQLGTKSFMLSCTMIEPFETGNACVVVKDYGRDLETFKEEALLKEYTSLFRSDWTGSTWPPNVVHIDVWDLVGGLSTEFSPGMYSDPDFSKKLFDAGVRIFKGVGNSLVYHFGSKSTGRVKKNKGRITFLWKWGITSSTFTKYFLKMGSPYSGPLTLPVLSWSTRFINKLKRFKG